MTSTQFKLTSVVLVLSITTLFLLDGDENSELNNSNSNTLDAVHDEQSIEHNTINQQKTKDGNSGVFVQLKPSTLSLDVLEEPAAASTNLEISKQTVFLEDEVLNDAPSASDDIPVNTLKEYADHDSAEADLPGFEDVDTKFGIADSNYAEPDGFIDDVPPFSLSSETGSIDENAEHDAAEADLPGFEDVNYKFGITSDSYREPEGNLDDAPK